MILRNNLVRCALALLVVYAAMLATACPTRSDFVKAYNASEASFTTIEQAALNIGALYDAKVISYEFKEKAIAKLRDAQSKAKIFKAAVDTAYAAYGRGIPSGEIARLDMLLSDVIGPVFDILSEAGVLPPAAAEKVRFALLIAKQTLLTIAAFFGKLHGTASISYQFYLQDLKESYGRGNTANA